VTLRKSAPPMASQDKGGGGSADGAKPPSPAAGSSAQRGQGPGTICTAFPRARMHGRAVGMRKRGFRACCMERFACAAAPRCGQGLDGLGLHARPAPGCGQGWDRLGLHARMLCAADKAWMGSVCMRSRSALRTRLGQAQLCMRGGVVFAQVNI
jgi:hypothetical protein